MLTSFPLLFAKLLRACLSSPCRVILLIGSLMFVAETLRDLRTIYRSE